MIGSLLDSAKTGGLKYVIMFFVLLAGGGLVLMDVGGFFTGGAPATAIVTIDGQKITKAEFDRDFRDIAYRQNISPEEAYQRGLADQYLNGLVAQNLVSRAAHDNGLKINPRDMVDEIRQYIAPFITDEIDAKKAFENMLRSQNMNEERFTALLIRDKVNRILTSSIADSVAVPGSLAKDFALATRHTRKIDSIILPFDNQNLADSIDDEALQGHYEQIKDLYATPEKRDFDAVIFSLKDLEKNIEVTDEQVQDYFQENADLYIIPETRKFEQALLADQPTAQKVYDLFKDGSTLKDAVIKVTGNDKAYRAADKFEKAGLLEPLNESVFSAKENDILEPSKSLLGWHVVHLISIEEESSKGFAEVEKELRDHMHSEMLEDQFYELSIALEETLDSGVNAKDAAAQFHFPTKSLSNIAATDGDKLVFANTPALVLKHVFDIAEGETSMLFEDGNQYIAVTATKVTPKSYPDFAEVKDDVKKRYIESQKRELAQNKASQIRAKIENGELTLEQAAKDNGIEVKTVKALSRFDSPPEYIGASNLVRLFKAKKDDVILITNNDYIVLAKVDSIALPSTDLISESEVAQQGENLGLLFQNVNLEAYITAMQDRYKVKTNANALKELYVLDESEAY